MAARGSDRRGRHIRGRALSDVVDQTGRRDAERVGQRMNVVERNVALAALDRPRVRAMDSREIGERLLREPALEPQRFETLPELAPSAPCDCLARSHHCGRRLCSLLTMRRQPISSI